MSWLRRLLGQPHAPVTLDDSQQQRLAAWQNLPPHDWKTAHASTRFLIVDVEASGLNMKQDRLISIGAVALCHGLIDPADAFEVVLRQDQVSSRENILIHGISGSEQREGLAPAEALLQFLEYSQRTPLVAYHAFFDQSMIARAMRTYLGVEYAPQWLDLAWLMPSLFPDRFCNAVPLDKWLEQFGISNFQRHNAISDCLATAQLLQIALQRARERQLLTLDSLATSEALYRRKSW